MKKGSFHVDIAVHDPAIFVEENGEYYIFGTHMTAAVSKDLRYWKSIAEGVNARNPLFTNLFDAELAAFRFCGKFNGREYAVWAPDVYYNPVMGKYIMYFCTSGSYVKSCICMAVADRPEGPYTYIDTILCSGFDEKTVELTNVFKVLGENADISRYLKKNGHYNNLRWPNCIDPNVFRDKDGRLYMVYGSWSGGIFLLELDESTGRPVKTEENCRNGIDPYFGKKLLGGGHKSIEGPYILYDAVADYYYLFVSFGWLARDGGYQIRLFRSKKVDGPYVDMDGKTFRRVSHHDPYGLKMIGNYQFPSMEYGYKSPGHNSAFIDRDGKMYIVYHQRFDIDSELHEPRVHQLFRTRNGWLTVAPFATEGEMLCAKSYQQAEVCGIYYVVEHGLDISAEVKNAVRMVWKSDGRIVKSILEDNGQTKEQAVGDYRLENESRIIISIGDITYDCVIVQLNDEAGNPTMCFTGVGNNQSVWAVRYL